MSEKSSAKDEFGNACEETRVGHTGEQIRPRRIIWDNSDWL